MYVYAAETALQITLTELNENLRQIYLEAYTQEHLLDYIQRATAKELYRIFGPYQPELKEQDFYELEFGTAGLMRGYRVRRPICRRCLRCARAVICAALPSRSWKNCSAGLLCTMIFPWTDFFHRDRNK